MPKFGDMPFQTIMDKANVEFNNPFKKTNNLSQLFKQAEIDAIGINISENTVYATDIAFHENGLSYGDKYETSKRITKKIIRTILLLQHYFSNITNHKIIFISPKINPEPLSVLESALSRILNFVDSESISCEIQLISNTKFQNQILNPITNLSKNVADTSELFLRSIQLVNLFQPVERTKNRIIVQQPSTNGKNNFTKNHNETEVDGEIKKIQRRVPQWFRHPHRINSTILIAYLKLSEQSDNITEQLIRNQCENISTFTENFYQMKHIRKNNHGKVFHEEFGKINLWEPVEQFILDEYKSYKQLIFSHKTLR